MTLLAVIIRWTPSDRPCGDEREGQNTTTRHLAHACFSPLAETTNLHREGDLYHIATCGSPLVSEFSWPHRSAAGLASLIGTPPLGRPSVSMSEYGERKQECRQLCDAYLLPERHPDIARPHESQNPAPEQPQVDPRHSKTTLQRCISRAVRRRPISLSPPRSRSAEMWQVRHEQHSRSFRVHPRACRFMVLGGMFNSLPTS